jgi:molybdate transport system substrate-binding protein
VLRSATGIVFALVLPALASCGPDSGDTLYVAVAANFAEPAREIASRFTEVSGENVRLSFGSTGQLFAQISQGAPFDIFLAADQETPARMVSEGWGVAESVFTYATGEIVLYGPTLDLTDGEAVLRSGEFDRIAIAAFGLEGTLDRRVVEGNNIAQAFQFVETGNAELGFVARSQIASAESSSVWSVPADAYSPIHQDGVVLTRGAANAAAQSFVTFLKSPEALGIIRGFRSGPSRRS